MLEVVEVQDSGLVERQVKEVHGEEVQVVELEDEVQAKRSPITSR